MRHEFAGDLFALASAQMAELKHRVVMANGIRIHLAEAGKGPFVLMVHGFPESWLSNLC
ncbi:hypothetical protein [Candidatus Binatus sp.]|jgi:hypothetical protein|uniref:hypothetical protein n=1 Tax=Candidatus Binatus sp. TaxID=2811406 RepID=UPI002FDA9619